MLTLVLDSATKVIVNTHSGKWAPHAGFYMASLRQSRKSSIECHLDEYTASHWLKIYIWELAQTSPIRQLFAPFSEEGGIRLLPKRIDVKYLYTE